MVSSRRSCDQPPAAAEQIRNTPSQPDLGDYQRAWDEELGGNPTWVLVGIGIALLMFASVGVLPWALSYLQDNGIIRPRVHWREHLGDEPVPVKHSYQHHDTMTTSFGRPRAE